MTERSALTSAQTSTLAKHINEFCETKDYKYISCKNYYNDFQAIAFDF